MTEHYIVICKECGKIIEQCRCMAMDKTKIYRICDECLNEKKDE